MITITRQSRPAQHDKTILLTADERYFPYAMFLAHRIDALHPARDFDICLVSNEPLPQHPMIDKIGIRVLELDISDLEDDLNAGKRLSLAAYLRLIVPQLVGGEYRRILYMDGDMLQLRGDLSTLLEAEIGDHAIAAVHDDAQLRKDRITHDMKALGFGKFKYLNSGLLLIDVPCFNAQGLGEQALSFAREHPDDLRLHDQTAINAVLQGNWAELSLVWNYPFWRRSMYFAVHFNPAILHFIGEDKPWSSRRGIFPRWILQAYRDFFAAHFPQEFNRMQGLPTPLDKPVFHVSLLLEHAWNFHRFMPNVKRFKDDWDIKL